ncbi:uncharacterized protein SAPINGB_P003704 [Magnusiomyces paraingens]|uniref:AAA+ ATPase domain-containing protein n=1 Tax=Magnusiomyces paraingens TaxID=2606893 RepID=A0A5E8BW42_9ASCO|nr:uncharacterized protein SAPINGB_P003704 [Saprochaete ingens]VVT53697.1 unnamed protein product [Saprochaete ingens]
MFGTLAVSKKKIKRREPTFSTSLFISNNDLSGVSTDDLEEINRIQKEDEIWHKSHIVTETSPAVVLDSGVLELPISDVTQVPSSSSAPSSSTFLKPMVIDDSIIDSSLSHECSSRSSTTSLGSGMGLKRTIEVECDEGIVEIIQEPKKRRSKREFEVDPSRSNIYTKAQALFQRGTGMTSVVGRDIERATIREFLETRLKVRGKGALYISGLPGTGKSALLTEVAEQVIQEHRSRYPIRIVNINCMTMENAVDIFSNIHRELIDNSIQEGVPSDFFEDYDDGDELEDDGRNDIIQTYGQLMQDANTRSIIRDLEKRLFSKKHEQYIPENIENSPQKRRRKNKYEKLHQAGVRHIFILDELDSIMTKDQEVLFRIFQWAFARNSSLILFGIANALDLTDRFLPRLRSSSLTPQLLPFKPYSDVQIVKIISERLWSMAPTDMPRQTGEDNNGAPKKPAQPPMMDTSGIMLCAKKTAANTGDLRKAFDICRRALAIVEEDVRLRFILAEKDGEEALKSARGRKRAVVTGRCAQKMAELNLETAPRVTIAHVSRVCSVMFGNTTTNRIGSLNLQQKAVLCTLVSLERHRGPMPGSKSVSRSTRSMSTISVRNITVAILYERYVQACDQERDMTPLGYADFMDIVSILESHGVAALYGVCGRRGLGNNGSRHSRGGSGSGFGRNSNSVDDFGHRRISGLVSYGDLEREAEKTLVLKPFLRPLA